MLDARILLVVAAHPDDEALGCGGTMARMASEGANVHVLFLSEGVTARPDAAGAELNDRRRMGERAAEILGAAAPVYLDFPDNRLDSVDLLDVVQAVEEKAARLSPDAVLTHFPGDLNVDHRRCAQAVMTAFRPFPGQTVRTIFGFETPSSTEWAFGIAGMEFVPQLFVNISDHWPAKRAALDAYAHEMRPFPHARSIEGVEALARWRGASAGVSAAEAFCLMRGLR